MIDDLSASVPDAPRRSREVLITTVTMSFSERKLESAIKWWGVRMRFLYFWVLCRVVWEKHSSLGVCLEANRRQMRVFYSSGLWGIFVSGSHCGISLEGSVSCYSPYTSGDQSFTGDSSVKLNEVEINDQKTLKELFVIKQLLFCLPR